MPPRHKKSYLLSTNKAAPLSEQGRKNFDKIFRKEKTVAEVDGESLCGSEKCIASFEFQDGEKTTLQFEGIVREVQPLGITSEDLTQATEIRMEITALNGAHTAGEAMICIRWFRALL